MTNLNRLRVLTAQLRYFSISVFKMWRTGTFICHTCGEWKNIVGHRCSKWTKAKLKILIFGLFVYFIYLFVFYAKIFIFSNSETFSGHLATLKRVATPSLRTAHSSIFNVTYLVNLYNNYVLLGVVHIWIN